MEFLGTDGLFALYNYIRGYADDLENGHFYQVNSEKLFKRFGYNSIALVETANALYTRRSYGCLDQEVLEELRLDCPDYTLILGRFLEEFKTTF